VWSRCRRCFRLTRRGGRKWELRPFKDYAVKVGRMPVSTVVRGPACKNEKGTMERSKKSDDWKLGTKREETISIREGSHHRVLILIEGSVHGPTKNRRKEKSF